ncbi:SDR family NAD(P)-dependent oxidoreductase [Cytobacillus horneckiae]|uniref:3-oxoacyl-ACP reductase n=1 Tax=Cytobacillus horneckiae TaxID=549687 RepID=A0A2N0ZAT8_9BACI|nr:SDR family oxidoreductase [Cytobacillus horneckiae]MEC1157208.1 SDR family oxidoreductase [Cytobacillus horneckiae]MED2938141.1 SDR family oxidoreductase [Cytobacillus horneckiae]PKG26622.1 3-oxoacyl-ACP reductase [Cytobacillus horneckiae]
MNLDLNGKNILITGAAKGIGRELALAAAKEGANIAVHYLTAEKEANQTVDEILQAGGKAYPFYADISKIEEVEIMRKEIEQNLGRIHYVVNNAGFVQIKSFFQYRPEEWRREMDVCFYGVLNLAYIFIPGMVTDNHGKFINIIGDSARTGDTRLIMSAAARNGAVSFLKSLAKDVGNSSIQCNTVALGMIDKGEFPDNMIARMMKQYPLRRLGKTDDITGMVLFLLSSKSEWITGQVFAVNGGYSMIG